MIFQIFKWNNSNQAKQPSLISQYLLNHLLTFITSVSNPLHHVNFHYTTPQRIDTSQNPFFFLFFFFDQLFFEQRFLHDDFHLSLTWTLLRRTFNDKSNRRPRYFRNYFSSILEALWTRSRSVWCVFSVGHVVGTFCLSQWRQTPSGLYAQPSTIKHRLRLLSLEKRPFRPCMSRDSAHERLRFSMIFTRGRCADARWLNLQLVGGRALGTRRFVRGGWWEDSWVDVREHLSLGLITCFQGCDVYLRWWSNEKKVSSN